MKSQEKKRRILFVSATSELCGPTNSLLLYLAYAKQLYDISVLVPGSGDFLGSLGELGVPCYLTSSLGLNRGSIPWLFRFLRNGKFDLVYGNGFNTGIRNALVATKFNNMPFIWHIREMLHDTRSSFQKSWFLQFADAVIAVSQATSDSIRKRASHPNIQVIYNGVNLDHYKYDRPIIKGKIHRELAIPDDCLIVANVGYLCERKGQLEAVKVALEILGQYPKTFFVFLGSPEAEPDYARTVVDSAKLFEDRILFLGSRSDIPRFLSGCDLLLHTARSDPNPRVVIEAMAARLPVVAFAVDGVKEEVVDGETGLLTPAGDVPALVQALRVCLSDAALRERMGEMGLTRVKKHFTADQTAHKISCVINSLMR